MKIAEVFVRASKRHAWYKVGQGDMVSLNGKANFIRSLYFSQKIGKMTGIRFVDADYIDDLR